jgi:hypothetical protein
MAAYAATRRRAGRPDQSLHCERGAFPTAHGRHGRGEARGGRGTTGRRANANRRGMTLSASWEAVMSHTGEIDRFHEDGFLGLLSPPPSRGSGAVGGG